MHNDTSRFRKETRRKTKTKMKWLIIVFILSSCTTIKPNEQYGFWVDRKPWKGTLLKNRNYIKPYRQCIDKETLNNINCK